MMTMPDRVWVYPDIDDVGKDRLEIVMSGAKSPEYVEYVRVTSDTIPLPRAEVEALLEAMNAAALTIDYAYGTTDDDGELDRKYSAFLRKALATLQERMK